MLKHSLFCYLLYNLSWHFLLASIRFYFCFLTCLINNVMIAIAHCLFSSSDQNGDSCYVGFCLTPALLYGLKTFFFLWLIPVASCVGPFTITTCFHCTVCLLDAFQKYSKQIIQNNELVSLTVKAFCILLGLLVEIWHHFLDRKTWYRDWQQKIWCLALNKSLNAHFMLSELVTPVLPVLL